MQSSLGISDFSSGSIPKTPKFFLVYHTFKAFLSRVIFHLIFTIGFGGIIGLLAWRFVGMELLLVKRIQASWLGRVGRITKAPSSGPYWPSQRRPHGLDSLQSSSLLSQFILSRALKKSSPNSPWSCKKMMEKLGTPQSRDLHFAGDFRKIKHKRETCSSQHNPPIRKHLLPMLCRLRKFKPSSPPLPIFMVYLVLVV